MTSTQLVIIKARDLFRESIRKQESLGACKHVVRVSLRRVSLKALVTKARVTKCFDEFVPLNYLTLRAFLS